MNRLSWLGRLRRPPEGRKIFKKFVEISHVKLINLLTFQKVHDFLQGFGQKYKNNWKFYPTRGLVARRERTFVIFPSIFLLSFYFSRQFAGLPQDKLIIPPRAPEKSKNFLKISDYFHEILKGFNVKW